MIHPNWQAIRPYFNGFPALMLAIFFAVLGTTLLKIFHIKQQYRFLLYVGICYVTAFVAMTLSLRYIALSVVYAVWSGVGTVLTTVIGIYYFQEKINSRKIFFLCLVILGVVGVYLA